AVLEWRTAVLPSWWTGIGTTTYHDYARDDAPEIRSQFDRLFAESSGRRPPDPPLPLDAGGPKLAVEHRPPPPPPAPSPPPILIRAKLGVLAAAFRVREAD